MLFLIAAAVMLAVLAFFGARTVLRHDVWLNDETLFSSILEEDPNRTEARLNLGRFYWLDGQFEKAEREYRYVADLDKNHAEARFRLGTIASARSDLAEAIAWLEEALRLDPEHLHAHFELARSLDVSARSLADEVVKLRGAGLVEKADAAAGRAAEFKRRAAEHYRRFLSLVESTGADVPLGKTSRARNRLHALEGAGGAEGGSDAGAGGGGAGGGG